MQIDTIKILLVPDCVSYMQLELLIQQPKKLLTKALLYLMQLYHGWQSMIMAPKLMRLTYMWT